MASMESMLRNINRQLEQHARIFGTDSETYKDYVQSIERHLGKANYTQRSGAVGYSRSIPMTYKFEDVQRANELAKGKNTAASKWSRGAENAMEQGIPIKKATDYMKLKDEVEKNFQAIYDLMQEEYASNFYKSGFSRLSNQTFDDDILTHIAKNTQYKTMDEIKEMLRKAKRRDEERRAEIEKEAEKTPTQHLTKKEVDRILRDKRKSNRDKWGGNNGKGNKR